MTNSLSQPTAAPEPPDQLAAVARLFGMQPPPIDECRVLELGFASGGNLIPMADRLPESRFVGIDYSRSQAQLGVAQRLAAMAQLKNIELRHADIAELGDELGTFDYIICHGVFSWVTPRPAGQDSHALPTLLSPAGRGLHQLQYAVPAGISAAVLREMMCRLCAGRTPAFERLVEEGRCSSFCPPAWAAETLVRRAYAGRSGRHFAATRFLRDSRVFRNENHPAYFHEFVSRVGEFQLQYLGEAATATMFASNFGPLAEQQIVRVCDSIVSSEQHLDVLRNRSFRQTLLCREGIELVRRIGPAQLEGLYFAGRIQPQNERPDLKSNASESFKAPSGLALATPSPRLKAALFFLNAKWPRAVSFAEIVQATAQVLGERGQPLEISDQARRDLAHNIIQCIATGLLQITSAPDSFVTTVSDHPEAAPLARAESLVSEKVTNRRHELVQLDNASKNLLRHLDGRHDCQALLTELVEAVNRGDMSILVGGIPATSGEAVSDVLATTLGESLAKLAANALLVA